MQNIINDFDERVREINLYFRFLEKLEEPDVSLHFPNKRSHKYQEVT